MVFRQIAMIFGIGFFPNCKSLLINCLVKPIIRGGFDWKGSQQSYPKDPWGKEEGANNLFYAIFMQTKSFQRNYYAIFLI